VKRYIVFAGLTYYPSGGWKDFVSEHDTKEEAIASAKKALDIDQGGFDWAQILDCKDQVLVTVTP
jgi:hypothetical protein